MTVFRKDDLASPGLYPPPSLLAKIDWKNADAQQSRDDPFEEHKLYKISRTGGGNCFYACIAKAVYIDETLHPHVRKSVMDFYTQVLVHRYHTVIVEDQTFLVYGFGKIGHTPLSEHQFADFIDKWVENAGKNNVCCSQMDMIVAAYIFCIQIILMKFSGKMVYAYDANSKVKRDENNKSVMQQEGMMGTQIISAISPFLENFIPLPQRRSFKFEKSTHQAEVKPIMIYNQYSPGIINDVYSGHPVTDGDETGHYTLLGTQDATSVTHGKSSIHSTRHDQNDNTEKVDQWRHSATNTNQLRWQLENEISSEKKQLELIEDGSSKRTKEISNRIISLLHHRLVTMQELTNFEISMASDLDAYNASICDGKVQAFAEKMARQSKHIDSYKHVPASDKQVVDQIQICILQKQMKLKELERA